MSTTTAPPTPLGLAGDHRSARAVAAVRVAFGLAWVVDATMKWSPSFTSGFVGYFSGERAGQPSVVKTWLGWWIGLIRHDPTAWAHVVAGTETLLAVGLVLGACTRLVCAGGAAFSLLVWATAEGFGGPYGAGSTDIGTSVIYALLFVALLAVGAGGWGGLDRWLGATRLRPLCSRPRTDLAGPGRPAVALAAVAVAAALAVGCVIAFVDAPAPAGAMSMPAPTMPAMSMPAPSVTGTGGPLASART